MTFRPSLFLLALPAFAQVGYITTVAGNGNPANPSGSSTNGDGGLATSAMIVSQNDGVAVDSKGNLLICEPSRLRRVDSTTGIITTIAGGGPMLGDGIPATSAFLNLTGGAASDAAGNIYVSAGSTIKKIDTSGMISTVAGNLFNFGYSGDGGPAINAGLQAHDLAFDAAGNIYISDTLNNRIRKVTAATGIITTIAGNGSMGYGGDGGPATSAVLSSPQGVSVDAAGNVYFADLLNQRVRKVDTSGNISTIASGLISPEWTAVDAAGNVYICDAGQNEVLKLDTSKNLTAFAGNHSGVFGGDGGPATSAGLALPSSIALDRSNNLYILDTGHYRVRKVQGQPPTGGAPIIAGVVNGASYVSGVTSNAWATITGTNLSAVTDVWNDSIVGGKLPTSLDGVSVTIGFVTAYIAYVSPTQINLIVPPSLSGSVGVVVTNPAGTSATFSVTASSYAPGFFVWPGNQPVATYQNYTLAAKNGTFASATTPAKPGDVLILWGTGLGPTIPAIPPGIEIPALPGGMTYSTSQPVTVTVNNVAATVYGAAYAVGYAGLFQVAIQVPTSLANGDWPLVATVGGVQSAPTTLAVHN